MDSVKMLDLRPVFTSNQLKDGVVIYVFRCPFCNGYHRASYSEVIALAALKDHMVYEHRAELLKHIRDHVDVDQVMLDIISTGALNAASAVRSSIRKYIQPHAIAPEKWVGALDIVRVVK